MLTDQIKTLTVREETIQEDIEILEETLKNKKNELSVIRKAIKRLEKLQEQLGYYRR